MISGELPLRRPGPSCCLRWRAELERVGGATRSALTLRLIAGWYDKPVPRGRPSGRFASGLTFLTITERRSAPAPPAAGVRDIPLLVRSFSRTSGEARNPLPLHYVVNRRACVAWKRTPWPWNIRELQHVVDRGLRARAGAGGRHGAISVGEPRQRSQRPLTVCCGRLRDPSKGHERA